MAPRARVIVSAYNQLPELRRALRGFLRQSTRDFGLVVADDGSTDGTAEFLASFAGEIEGQGIPFEHVWQEDRGRRKTRILNEAVRRAGEERLLLFTDGDCIPPQHFVERHLAVHEPRSFHVGGAYRLSRAVSEALTEADVDSGAFEVLKTRDQERDLSERSRKSRWGVWLRRPRRPKVLGLNMAFDRALFSELNGFDERFGESGLGDDTDMRDRAMRTRPRPRVKLLYGRNDVFHLWHPKIVKSDDRSYYRLSRPVRCRWGLVREVEAEGMPDPVQSRHSVASQG